MGRPRKKIRAKRTRKYKSHLERDIARRLGKKATYETEYLEYLLPKKYKPDFILLKKDGSKLFLEVKGYMRYEDQVKMKAVKTCNPTLDIRLYFPSDAKVQTSSMKNSEWCERYGFVYYIGRLPKDL